MRNSALFVFQSLRTFGKVKIDESVSMCVPLASDSSKAIGVTIVQLGTVTASHLRMHHVLIISTLTVMQGHTNLNHENNKLMFHYIKNFSSKVHQVFCGIPVEFVLQSQVRI